VRFSIRQCFSNLQKYSFDGLVLLKYGRLRKRLNKLSECRVNRTFRHSHACTLLQFHSFSNSLDLLNLCCELNVETRPTNFSYLREQES